MKKLILTLACSAFVLSCTAHEPFEYDVDFRQLDVRHDNKSRERALAGVSTLVSAGLTGCTLKNLGYWCSKYDIPVVSFVSPLFYATATRASWKWFRSIH